MNDGERIRSFEYDYARGGVLRSVTVDGELQGTFEYSLMNGRGSQQGTLKVSVMMQRQSISMSTLHLAGC